MHRRTFRGTLRKERTGDAVIPKDCRNCFQGLRQSFYVVAATPENNCRSQWRKKGRGQKGQTKGHF
ncbi:hypothetical protein CE91St1_57510 [Parabacteroides goldsteinii]|nr:hypothetical protein CE91St1_57510 [Parabacteroides goldsteinii]GKG79984.1 hypothetical protein CE91St2_31760 [Parabacteroides goldsteinii]